MTDNEIKKALEERKYGYIVNIHKEYPIISIDDILDLINRLQAEIEDKQTVIKEQGKIINGLVECQGKAIISAYEEFAELVKANKSKLFNYIYSSKGFDNQIDNLLKEMVSEDKVQWSKQGECPITPEQFEAIYNDEVGEDK